MTRSSIESHHACVMNADVDEFYVALSLQDVGCMRVLRRCLTLACKLMRMEPAEETDVYVVKETESGDCSVFNR